MKAIKTISFIGSGNVATHLAIALKSNYTIQSIYSQQLSNAELLAQKVDATATNEINSISPSDLIIIAVKDDVIEEVASKIDTSSSIVAHTSGSVPMNVLKGNAFGIFYPLQTFSKASEVAISSVPFCIEGSDTETFEALESVAKSISENVQHVTSGQRKQLHLAAVFACNFSNHMFSIAQELLQEHNMDLSLLIPLIKETANKTDRSLPTNNQTGPAKRNDKNVMNKHQKMLESNPDYQKIYTLLSESIVKFYHEKEL